MSKLWIMSTHTPHSRWHSAGMQQTSQRDELIYSVVEKYSVSRQTSRWNKKIKLNITSLGFSLCERLARFCFLRVCPLSSHSIRWGYAEVSKALAVKLWRWFIHFKDQFFKKIKECKHLLISFVYTILISISCANFI